MSELQIGIDKSEGQDCTGIVFFRRLNSKEVKIEKSILLTPKEVELLLGEFDVFKNADRYEVAWNLFNPHVLDHPDIVKRLFIASLKEAGL